MNDDNRLNPEDYQDPICPFCTDAYEKEPPARTVPLRRILERADAMLARRDYDGAEKLFLYWAEEAKTGRDLRGEMSVLSELMGLYRKLGRKDDAVRMVERSMDLAKETGLGDSVSGATVYLNAATVYKAFGRPEKAMPLFERAKEIYLSYLPSNDARLGGLYNNMGLAQTDLKDYEGAETSYANALIVMRTIEGGEGEMAITYLNMADLVSARDGEEDGYDEINRLVGEAERLLRSDKLVHDGYYAFICEKCAPTFERYGFFAAAQEFSGEAERIYAGY